MAIKIAPIFSDRMVLQRQKKIKVWGIGSEGSQIEVTLHDNKATCKVKDGQWMLELPSMEAGGPYIMSRKVAQSFGIMNM